MGDRVIKFLESVGCCRRCILIHLGERSDFLYGDLTSINETIKKTASQLNIGNEEVETDFQDISNFEHESNKDAGTDICSEDVEEADEVMKMESSTPEHTLKKQKCAVCITCIGLLQSGCSADVVKLLSEAILGSGHDAEYFTLALSFPVSLSVRVHRVWSLLLQAYPQFPKEGREDHVGTIKDVWKNVVGPQVAAAVGKSFVIGSHIEFALIVSCTHIHDVKDCGIMDQLCGAVFVARQKKHKKFSKGVYSKQAVDAALKKLNDQDFLRVCPEPPSIPDESVSFSNLHCHHAPLYMAGRYNKYSRDLPQTPWFVEGERKLDSSVQELLSQPLIEAVHATDIKFSSSGREDVDVRCLGNGRPFVVEFVNPHRTKFSQAEVTDLQNSINNSTRLIHLRDLQIVDRRDIRILKEGEEEKTKAYCALCIAHKGYDSSVLEKLGRISQLTVQQKTPLRVLHRRPLATRHRIIHSMRASPVDDHFFKLHLTTQAGTYIKEFVHGDLGRTSPNLGSILGLDMDIIALDVENVALDWPPKCAE